MTTSAMPPAEIREARVKLGLTPEQMALLLGYSNRNRVYQAEADGKMDAAKVRLLRAYLDGYRPDDWPV